MTHGYNNPKNKPTDDNYTGYLYPENYDCYNISERANYEASVYENPVNYDDSELEGIEYYRMPQPLDGPPMDSAWPMFCHDVRHTGRSPFSTADNPGIEKWRSVIIYEDFSGSPVIDNNGTIYVGSWDFYAFNPNGTVKWENDDLYCVETAAAIDENGIIYVGDRHGYFFAINPDGTLKWKISTGDNIFSSPAIADDGTIFFGDGGNWNIKALYPNGTLKWKYKTGLVVYSSPVIGDDGTVYCGSHDNYLYALYPNNGTLKWKFGTGHWVRTSPCIGDDGTIYFVSLDSYLYAVYPNGTMRWKTDVGAGTHPTIGQDGTIYCGYSKLHAVNPINGSIKWKFDVSGKIRGGAPCHSVDGTIYLGTNGGWIYAIYTNGTLRWKKKIGTEVESAPAIDKDGTVYIGSYLNKWVGGSIYYPYGNFHAFGDAVSNDSPTIPMITGPHSGLANKKILLKFVSVDPDLNPISYYINWGDGNNESTKDYGSDEKAYVEHKWINGGNYTVKVKAIDSFGSESNWSDPWEITINEKPYIPAIDGPKFGFVGQDYEYTFRSIDPDGDDVYYYVDWDDEIIEEWIGPYSSGKEIIINHSWSERGKYTIKAKAKDIRNSESDWGYLEVNMPRTRTTTYLWYQWLKDKYPLLEVIISRILSL